MKREAKICITGCSECPFIKNEDDFARNRYYCNLLEKYSGWIYGHNNNIEREITKWFTNLCPLPEIKSDLL